MNPTVNGARNFNTTSALAADDKQLDLSKYEYRTPEFTDRKGIGVVRDSWNNKGTGFSSAERDRLGIRGLVPPRQLPLDVQAEKIMHMVDSITDPLDKASFLSDLQDRNETLFFRVLIDNLERLAPYVYTPTVGQVCLRFGSYFRRARGMYFSSEDEGQYTAMVYNWPHDDVEIVVVTDGSRVLGLGDLGANGMGIPIGKLALYVAAGGINPRKVLPVMLDLGTDNEALSRDPWYLGVTHPRLEGDEYFAHVHEFMNAVRTRWPNALVQFEDFSSDKAAPLLEAYKSKFLCFNDDIQGTGSVTVGALLASVRTQGEDAKLSDQRIVICGAGSAGMGIASSLVQAMGKEGLSPEEARERFWIIDKDGLIGGDRKPGTISATNALYARKECGSGSPLQDGSSIYDVVKQVRPTILIGVTGRGGTFTEDIVREMAKHNDRPIIFPLSNPTSNAECTAEQAYEWTEGRAVFGSGSPFDAVTLPSGEKVYPSQINNMFIFPGIGLASQVVRPKLITDSMFLAAAKAMADMVSPEDLATGRVVPRVRDIRDVSARVAAAAAGVAIEDGIAGVIPPAGDLAKYMEGQMYNPAYGELIPLA